MRVNQITERDLDPLTKRSDTRFTASQNGNPPGHSFGDHLDSISFNNNFSPASKDSGSLSRALQQTNVIRGQYFYARDTENSERRRLETMNGINLGGRRDYRRSNKFRSPPKQSTIFSETNQINFLQSQICSSQEQSMSGDKRKARGMSKGLQMKFNRPNSNRKSDTNNFGFNNSGICVFFLTFRCKFVWIWKF
jgi:hypothetical protein